MTTTLTTKDITKQTPRFVTALQEAKTLEAELQAFYARIEDEMKQHAVTSVKGHWGSLTLASRRNWKGSNLPPRFYKQTLDTTRLNFMYKAGDKLPEGASFTESIYLSKRIK